MKLNNKYLPVIALLLLLASCSRPAKQNNTTAVSSDPSSKIPDNMYYVTPISNDNAPGPAPQSSAPAPVNKPQGELQVRQGQFFSYALPPGWRLGEDGQFALTLVAPDNQAFTVMVGNAGFMPDYPPGQFVYEKMQALRPANLQVGQAQQASPVAGFQQAYSFPVSYQVNGQQYRGIATCHVAPYYGGCTMAMTAAIAESNQWNGYSSWLPAVSRQIAATNGAAFGMRGVMQQNLRNSMAYAQAAQAYRDWSAQKQQEVTDYRNAVNDKQNEQFRDNLGAVQRYNDPYNNGTEVQLGTQYKYYWMDRQGKILGTNDANVNPNDGGGGDWQQMQTKEY
ncbi:MAG: hypothetical protein QM687_12230 [Ferruginibacter sp.]